MAVAELARQEWAGRATAVLEAEREDAGALPGAARPGRRVADELRRRIGQTFTLAELAPNTSDADAVGREASPTPPATTLPPGVTSATDAAFHLYARGATDYAP